MLQMATWNLDLVIALILLDVMEISSINKFYYESLWTGLDMVLKIGKKIQNSLKRKSELSFY